MRFFIFIFAGYFIALNTFTCQDEALSHASSTCEQHSSEDDHEDFCSPFCYCNCCSISVIGDDLGLQEESFIFRCDTQHSIFHSTPSCNGFNDSILQPPQLNS